MDLLKSRGYKYYQAFLCTARFVVILDNMERLVISSAGGSVPHPETKCRKSIIGVIFM
jgi:hypothetical protein